MATFEKRITDDGKTHIRVKVRMKGAALVTATFERLTDARIWATQTEAAIRDGRHFKTVEAKRHTMTEMIDRYMRDVLTKKKIGSQYSQTIQLDWWKKQIGHLIIADLTPAVIAEQRDILLNGETYRHTKRAPSSVIRYLAALSHCFTIAMKEWGWVDDNPLRKVTKPREPRGRVRFLSDDERARLLTTCRESRNRFLYPIVILAISTGMRKNEIRGLRWEDVDLQRGIITLHETKNDERRSVPLVGHALDVLKEHAKVRRMDTSLVFPAPFRYGESPKPIDIQSAWDWSVDRAGIEDFRFHDLRHSAASYLIMSGASIGEVAEILGHKTLQMVRRYSHISQPHAAKVVERMNAAIFAPPKAQEEGGNQS